MTNLSKQSYIITFKPIFLQVKALRKAWGLFFQMIFQVLVAASWPPLPSTLMCVHKSRARFAILFFQYKYIIFYIIVPTFILRSNSIPIIKAAWYAKLDNVSWKPSQSLIAVDCLHWCIVCSVGFFYKHEKQPWLTKILNYFTFSTIKFIVAYLQNNVEMEYALKLENAPMDEKKTKYVTFSYPGLLVLMYSPSSDLNSKIPFICKFTSIIGMLKHFDIFERSALCNFVG